MDTIRSLSSAYRDGSADPEEVAGAALERMSGPGRALNCFITVLRDSALAQARESRVRHRGGAPLGPLDGVPLAVKDLFYIEGVRCTAGSKILERHVATYDSPAVRRLKDAGAVILGTTNMHEFAAGITGENPHYGTVPNPWDAGRISGGSSSGSAAAVSAGLAVAALGTDTAGSVRVPAALCGVVGLKPTYGRVSRLGVVPLAPSFDTVGTLTRSAWDAAAMLGVLAGHDPEDLTTVPADVPDYLSLAEGDARGLRIGVPRGYFGSLADAGVVKALDDLLGALADDGCEVVERELRGIEKASDCWRTIRLSESAAFHGRWMRESPSAYGSDVRASLEEGAKIPAVDYVSAQNLRPLIMHDFAESMKDLDAVALPTTCVPAPPIGAKSVQVSGRELDVRTALISLTLPFSLTGFPSVSVPAGLSAGLPVGVQLAAKPFEEVTLLRLASRLEELHPFPEPPRTV